MKALKWFGLTILGIILFFSLTAFGLAFTVKQTMLNSNFLAAEINKFPLTEIIQQNSAFEMDIPDEVKESLDTTITALEPQLKQEAGNLVKSLLDYFLDRKPAPELAATLRGTILKDSLVSSLIDNLDVATLLASTIREQLQTEGIPSELRPLLDEVKPILVKVEPEIKIQLKRAIPAMLDYVLGESNSFSVTFTLDSVVDDIKIAAKNILKNNPDFAAMSDAQLSAYIDQNLALALDEIASEIKIDQSAIGTDARMTEAIENSEDALALAKPYIIMFNQYYIWLIVLMVLLTAGIAAIHHSVKGATRSLGSIFLSYGIIEFVPLVIFRFLIAPNLVFPEITADVPAASAAFYRQAIFDFMSPLWWFSLGCLLGGIALLVVSYVYRPAQPATTAPATTTEPTPPSS